MFDHRKSEFKKASEGPKGSERLLKSATELRRDKRMDSIKRFRNLDNESNVFKNQITILSTDTTIIDLAVSDIKSADKNRISQGLNVLKCALSQIEPPIEYVLKQNITDIFSAILLSNIMDDSIKSDILWCLANIATGDHDQTGVILPLMPVLLQLISVCNNSMQEQICWVIANIAGDSDEYRQVLVANGACKPLTDILLHVCVSDQSLVNIDKMKTCAWALSNLIRGTTPASVVLSNPSVMIKLLELLNHTNLDIVFEIAWIFVFLTAKDDDSVKMLLDNGLVGILLEIICRNDIVDSIVIPIIRCLGNITSGQVEWIDMLFKYNSGVNMNYFFTKFLNIRNIPQPIVKETTWVLSNILAGNDQHRASMYQLQLINPLVEIFVVSDRFDIQREALFGLRHASYNKDLFLSFNANIFHTNFISGLINLFKVSDNDVIISSLQLIEVICTSSPENMTRCVEYGLVDSLDVIQYNHPDEYVRRMASVLADVIDEYDYQQ